ncbi:hypothetical protein N0V88_007862 [Collariella sp. IMI 366227]|nr:hypothetical protein N0V88_007862 [Collariella sp. IMI 366227]
MSKEQLFQLLPLPDDGLQQVLEYATTLSKADAAEHFSNMLGDSPQVVEFISTFNSRRAEPRSAQPSAPTTAPSSAQNSEIDAAPKHRRGPKKKKAPLHAPPPRQVASFEIGPGTVYNKKDQQEVYMSGRPGTSTPSHSKSDNRRRPHPLQCDREAHKRTEPARPFVRRGIDDAPDYTVAEAMALQHRDKLLEFQAQNARRTTVRDEAADFDASVDAGSMWASAEERALALKRQQKAMREMEWNARPEYEKRQQVGSTEQG